MSQYNSILFCPCEFYFLLSTITFILLNSIYENMLIILYIIYSIGYKIVYNVELVLVL